MRDRTDGQRESAEARSLGVAEVEELRRSRRHPRRTQFDYLHLRYLNSDLERELRALDGSASDVLDVFCGSRPYDDLMPAGARCVGFDVDDSYGTADVVSTEFLPFEDDSFDLVTCIEGFYFVPDPEHGVAEIRRVLRPGGVVILTVPLVWEYDPRILEHRFTAPELEALFADWDEVRVSENGGRGVAWATLTGHMIKGAERSLGRRWTRRAFSAAYAGLNALGERIERAEQRRGSPYRLPMNLMLVARRPPDRA